MNYLQILCFVVFVFSALSAGLWIYALLDRKEEARSGPVLFLGEVLVLGSSLIVGELLFLSLLGLYRIWILWPAVLVHNALLVSPASRRRLTGLLGALPRARISTAVFFLIGLLFWFRNCFFMVDIDSFSVYLFTQKLWLASGTSLTGDAGSDMRIFSPHSDYIPAALGIGLFPGQTLFPQFINFYWRALSLVLVYGYVSQRFNGLYALGAAALMLFDIHFFYSGINTSVTINGALIALLFFCAYNFWEARAHNSPFRFMLGLLLLPQLLLAKYQSAYALFILFAAGLLIQEDPWRFLRRVFVSRMWVYALGVSVFIASLWFVKNLVVTGTPFFPLFAGTVGSLGWTPQQENMFIRAFGGISVTLFLKYLNYLFIWPGLMPAKIVSLTISFLPLALCIPLLRSKGEVSKPLLAELSFWLALSLFMLMGVCLASHQDPRYYRFPLGIFVYTSVVSIVFLAREVLRFRKHWIIACCIFLPAVAGAKGILRPPASFGVPSLRDNIDVLLNKTHLEDLLPRYYPGFRELVSEVGRQPDKVALSAWGGCGEFNFPVFLLPIRPKITVWSTSVVRWDSYSSAALIERDLRRFGLEWIMLHEGERVPLRFVSVGEYARQIVDPDALRVQRIYGRYGLPDELESLE